MTGIIIQARLGSIRLPRKVLLPIAGKPMIAHTLMGCIKTEFPVVLAVPDGEIDEFKISLMDDNGKNCPISIYGGHPTDVLDRYYEVAKAFKFDPIVRITGDCPLVDSDMIKKMASEFVGGYLSNCHPVRTVPQGLDIEIFDFRSLEKAHKNAQTPEEREHVTLYFYQTTSYICATYSPPFPDSWKVCIDTQEDYERIKEIIEEGKYPWLN